MTERTLHSVCVFCGSQAGGRPAYVEGARRLGELLAREGIRIVYGGSSLGLMGALANAALDQGGTVTGIIPTGLVQREVANDRVSDLIVVGSMHERKTQMSELADGFIALPGGLGTLEEFFEILTWAQLGIHDKPCGLLNLEGYFEPLIAFLDRAMAEKFLLPRYRALLLQESDPGALLGRMRSYEPPEVEKWQSRT